MARERAARGSPSHSSLVPEDRGEGFLSMVVLGVAWGGVLRERAPRLGEAGDRLARALGPRG